MGARSVVGAVAAAGAVLAPAAVDACPFCAGTASSSNGGYLIATAILIALPFALFAGLVHWLRRYERTEAAPPREDRSR